MKICWDNLEKLLYSKKTGRWRHGNTVYRYNDKCKKCGEPFLYVKRKGQSKNFCSIECSNIYNKKLHSEETKEKIGRKNKGKYLKDKSPLWKGGSKEHGYYDTFVHQIDWIERCRRNKENPNILEVKCAYCGRWFVPKYKNIQNRISYLKGYTNKECRFYCSNSCKYECPIYNQKKYPKGFKKATSREVQPELRQMVLKRDNYTCQKCGSTEHLHCHHVFPVSIEPLESADIDNCITYCKECHIQAHKKDGCRNGQLRICIE